MAAALGQHYDIPANCARTALEQGVGQFAEGLKADLEDKHQPSWIAWLFKHRDKLARPGSLWLGWLEGNLLLAGNAQLRPELSVLAAPAFQSIVKAIQAETAAIRSLNRFFLCLLGMTEEQVATPVKVDELVRRHGLELRAFGD